MARPRARRSLRGCFVPLLSYVIAVTAQSRKSEYELQAYYQQLKYQWNRAPGPAISPARSEAVQLPDVDLTGFVSTNGTNFVVGGKPFYFTGTNAYYLGWVGEMSDGDVDDFFRIQSQNGLTITRTWAFSNGRGSPANVDVSVPIQDPVGVFHELPLRRMDLVLAKANEYKMKVTMALVNFWPEFGGMKWYVDQTIGPTAPLEAFYYDCRPRDAYKKYVSMMINRKNTITGVLYKDDPAIFAWELANEPRTTDEYEGTNKGALIRNWVYEMAAYIKGLDPNHMITDGSEGFQANGPTTGAAGGHDWIQTGQVGSDFETNVACPNISYATIHAYPQSWGFGKFDDWIGLQFIGGRAAIANALNKPIVLEEYGMADPPREAEYESILAYARMADVKATMNWQLTPFPVRQGSAFDFPWSGSGANAVRQQVQFMNDKMEGKYVPVFPPPPPCVDMPPAGKYSCYQQAVLFGSCEQPWMNGFCRISCGKCSNNGEPLAHPPSATPVAASSGGCGDVAPDAVYTCEQQAAWGKCSEAWMSSGGFCAKTCDRCNKAMPPATPAPTELPPLEPPSPPAPAPPPPPPTCPDDPPVGSTYSCREQAAFGKCDEPWMQGDVCLQSCGRCPAYPAVLPGVVAASGPKSGSIVEIAARAAPYDNLSQLSESSSLKIPSLVSDAAGIAALTARPIRPAAVEADRLLEVGRDYGTSPRLANAATVTNFKGDPEGTNTGLGMSWSPANPTICVGGGHMITGTEKFITIRNTSSPATVLAGPFPLWSYLGVPKKHALNLNFPRCVYDAVADRFIFAATLISKAADESALHMAVSGSSDPLAAWHMFSLPLVIPSIGVKNCSQSTPCYGDYLMVGQDDNSFWMSVNLFTPAAFQGPLVAACSKKGLMAGDRTNCAFFYERGFGIEGLSSVQPMVKQATSETDPAGVFYLAATQSIRRMAVFSVTGTDGLDKNPPVAPVVGQTVLLDTRTLNEPSPALQNNGKTVSTLDRRLQCLNYYYSSKTGVLLFTTANTDAIFTTVTRVGVAWFALNATEIQISRSGRAIMSSGVIGTSNGDTMFGSIIGPLGKQGTIGFVASSTQNYYKSIQGVITYYPPGTYREGMTEYTADTFAIGRGGALSTMTLDADGAAYGISTYAQAYSFSEDKANWGTVISRFLYSPAPQGEKPPAVPPPPPYTACPPLPCLDVVPAGGKACSAIKAANGCGEVADGFCEQSCGKCGALPLPPVKEPTCADIPPPDQDLNCYHVFYFWKCDEEFAAGFCNYSCRRCPSGATATPAVAAAPCTDTLPDDKFSCAQQKLFGKCSESWMLDGGHCAETCGRCSKR